VRWRFAFARPRLVTFGSKLARNRTIAHQRRCHGALAFLGGGHPLVSILTRSSPCSSIFEAETAAAANVIETMKDLAEKIDEIQLVMGLDGLKGFLPLANGNAEH
jgi:hypothetical protein